MKLVLQIASGIVIGVLVIFAYYTKVYIPKLDKDVENFQMIAKVNYLNEQLKAVYRLTGKIPRFVSDLHCSNDCPVGQLDGTFYLQRKKQIVAVTPKLVEGELMLSCVANLDTAQDYLPILCQEDKRLVIPEFQSATSNCNLAKTLVEKKICSNDRLIAADVALKAAYEAALAASSERQKGKLKQSQIDFIQQRELDCRDSQCIELATRKRIGELQSH